MRGFLNWLFDRRCSCDELRERVSLAERSERLLVDLVHAERAERIRCKEEAEMFEQLGDDLIACVSHLQHECDGLMRELWMERQRNQELRAELEKVTAEAQRAPGQRVVRVVPPDSIHRALRRAEPEGSNAGGMP